MVRWELLHRKKSESTISIFCGFIWIEIIFFFLHLPISLWLAQDVVATFSTYKFCILQFFIFRTISSTGDSSQFINWELLVSLLVRHRNQYSALKLGLILEVVHNSNKYLTQPAAAESLSHCYHYCIGTYPMSEEQLKAFIAKVQADTSLQEQLKAEGADVVAIAKAAGFSITTENLNYSGFRRQTLSDDELEGVAGGANTGCGQCPGETLSSFLCTLECWLWLMSCEWNGGHQPTHSTTGAFSITSLFT